MWLKSSPRTEEIFSKEDTQRLCSLFHPSVEKTGLFKLRSSEGFVRVERVRDAVAECVGLRPAPEGWEVPERVGVGEIAERVGVEEGVVEGLLPWGEKGWLLVEGGVAVTRVGYQALCKAIFFQVDEEPITTATFVKNNNISMDTFQRLVKEINSSLSPNSDEVVQGYILTFWGEDEHLLYSQRYRKWLEEEVAVVLKAADRPKPLIASTFQGSPPRPFLHYIANYLCETRSHGVSGHISQKNGQIEFVPDTYVTAQLDKLIDDLKSGTISAVRYSDLSGLGPRIADAKQYAVGRLSGGALVLRESMVSKVYVEKLVRDAEHRILAYDGWALLDLPKANLVGEDRSFIINEVMTRLAWDIPLANPGPLPGSSYVFSKIWLESLYDNVKNDGRHQAEQQWASGGQLKLIWSEVCEAQAKENSGMDEEVLRSIITPQKPHAETFFFQAVKQLEDEAIQKFSQDWKEKVLVRWSLHVSGLQDVSDAKLRGELYSALLDYTLETLVPDFLKKSTKKGAVKGKILERQTEKLRQSLLEVKINKAKVPNPLDSVGEALQAFSKAIKLEPLTDNLEEIKATHLKEMARNMEKDNDGPRLFLTLVLILHGTYGKGVIHASGKFAPRLLKQLTTLVDAEKYAWLQRMKDAARSGTITAEEKVELRGRAVEACMIR